LTSLATGEGLEVLRSLEGACLHDYRNTSKIPMIFMDYINGLNDMKKDNYRLKASPVSVTSAAYVHLLYEILGAHDGRIALLKKMVFSGRST